MFKNDDKPIIRTGLIKCLRCNTQFESIDVCKNRICVKCTILNNKEYVPKIASSRFYGKNTQLDTTDRD